MCHSWWQKEVDSSSCFYLFLDAASKRISQAWTQDSVVQDQDQDPDRQDKDQEQDSDAQDQDQDPDRQDKESDAQNQNQGQIKHDTAIVWHQYTVM